MILKCGSDIDSHRHKRVRRAQTGQQASGGDRLLGDKNRPQRHRDWGASERISRRSKVREKCERFAVICVQPWRRNRFRESGDIQPLFKSDTLATRSGPANSDQRVRLRMEHLWLSGTVADRHPERLLPRRQVGTERDRERGGQRGEAARGGPRRRRPDRPCPARVPVCRRTVLHAGIGGGQKLHPKARQPRGEEPVVLKHHVNSFRETDLKALLDRNGIEELVICGAMSHMCVDAGTRAAERPWLQVRGRARRLRHAQPGVRGGRRPRRAGPRRLHGRAAIRLRQAGLHRGVPGGRSREMSGLRRGRETRASATSRCAESQRKLEHGRTYSGAAAGLRRGKFQITRKACFTPNPSRYIVRP